MIRKCKYCGSYFDATTWNKMNCGRPDCVKANRRERADRCIEKKKIEKRKPKRDELVRDAKAARDLGVSYGYYMALYKGR